MKKTIIMLTLGLMAATTTSCVDDLDQRPVFEKDASVVYSSPDSYLQVLAKAYACFVITGQEKDGDKDIDSEKGYDLSRCIFNMQEDPTEESINTWSSLYNISHFKWDANDVWVQDGYYRLYYTISVCNEFIRNSGESSIARFDEAGQQRIRDMKAEARFLRALAYYWVLDLYAQGPFSDENTPISGYIPERYSDVQLFEFIEKELKEIEEEVPLDNEYGRVTRGAVWSLLARLYLNAEVYTRQAYYTECISYCNKVITCGKYSLEPEFYKLFNASNHLRTNEIIFPFVIDATTTVTFGATTNIICGSCSNSSSQDPAKYGITSGWGNFRVRGEIPAKFGDVATSKDSRCMFYTDGQTQYLAVYNDQTNGYFSEKFTNLYDDGTQASNTALNGCCTDLPVFRLADVYLMAAESVVRGGQGMTRSEALKLVNKVRERAYGDISGNITDAEMNLQFFIDERARELLHESVRRTDLRRFDMFTSDKYIWQWKGGVMDGTAVDPKYEIYPIPATELSVNTNLSNPNY